MSLLVHNHEDLKNRRKELRKNSTSSEKLLWDKLRKNNLGYKFKRQHSIGGYVLDFYCSEKRLIIELDGEIHNSKDTKEYDEVRDTYFKDLGYKTIRFWNKEIENQMEKVIAKIRKLLN